RFETLLELELFFVSKRIVNTPWPPRLAALRGHFYEELLDLGDETERFPLRRERGLVARRPNFLRGIRHERLHLRDQIHDLGGRALIDHFLNHLAGFFLEHALLFADALILFFPVRVVVREVGVREQKVFFHQPELRGLQRRHEREHGFSVAARHLAHVVAKWL